MKTKNNPILNDSISLKEVGYPLFSFKYVQSVSISGCKEGKFFYDFLLRLRKLDELGWKGIMKSDRHSFGTELIPIRQFKHKVDLPIITNDITKLMVFRSAGDNRIFAGLREGDVFQVIFIESRFGDIYDHS